MSVIVGFKKDGKIWMAGDSRVTYGTHIEKLADSASKIWTENDMMIVGGVGLLSELQVMRYSHIVPEEDMLLDNVDAEYLYALYSVYGKLYLDHFGITLDANTGYAQILNSSFMFGINDHLMVLAPDGSITEYEDFAVIGCADDLVRGYIMAHEDEEDVEKLLTDAIKHAATMDSGIDTNIKIYCIESPTHLSSMIESALKEHQNKAAKKDDDKNEDDDNDGIEEYREKIEKTKKSKNIDVSKENKPKNKGKNKEKN